MTRRLLLLTVLALGFLLQACATSKVHRAVGPDTYATSKTESSPSGRTIASRRRAPSSEDSTAGAAPKAPPSMSYRRSSRPSRSYRSYRRRSRTYYRRKSRPGLGTAYGERLYAPVQNVSFERYRSNPDAVLQLHYNSPAGVRAMARYLGGVSCCRSYVYRSGGGVSVRLTDRYGRRLRGLQSGGRVWVMGRHGHRYHIQIRNHTRLRKEVVVSVDGLDVIDGRRASTHKRGYILMPYATLNVNGFRRSYRHVAAFRFSRVSNSYAARTSGSRNVGVVGVAVFSEQSPRWDRRELNRRLYASPFATPPRY
ncbi:MAG: hypothetical protein EP343_33205 [Deltaproteobacteria bacterium]|nr:MAG: hypothetical protein EP343_33205 [Deltaproteobacteria bacterium]